MKMAELGEIDLVTVLSISKICNWNKTFQVESQCLHCYESLLDFSLLDFFRPKFEEDCHNLQVLRFKINCVNQTCVSSK